MNSSKKREIQDVVTLKIECRALEVKVEKV